MYYEKLCEKYRRKMITLHLMIVVVASILEIAVYSSLISMGKEQLSLTSGYLYKSLLLPIFVNIVVQICIKSICKVKELNSRIKDYAVIYAMLITSAIITLCHKEILACAFVFAIPILMLVVFNNKKLLGHATIFSLASLAISVAVLYGSAKMDSKKIVDVIIVVMILLILSAVSNMAISFYRENLREVEKRSVEKTKLQRMLKYDQLTGLYNREAFFEHLNAFIADYNSKGENFCMAILDIDDFKLINEKYSHDDGDDVLITLAGCLRRYKTRVDKVCRYGGEEFVFLIKTEEIAVAEEILNKVKNDFSTTEFERVSDEVTFSCGIVHYDGNLSAKDLFSKAGELLHRAKNLGKNTILSE